MTTTADPGSEYWVDVLKRGGSTTLPRWTLDPKTGVEQHESAVDHDLLRSLSGLAEEMDVTLGSVLLAAHAQVLSSLTGEKEVVTGYIAADGSSPLPCLMTTESDSWRNLLLEAHRSESDLLLHKDFPVQELIRESNLTSPWFDTLFNPNGTDAELGPQATVSLGFSKSDEELRLGMHYRADVLDAESAARLAGYHLTVLALIVADPEADPSGCSLLSAEERAFQIEGLAGPSQELPKRRFHELFEQQVAVDPEAIAVVHSDQQWTYGELNAYANRLARALVARGVRKETVVAVLTERNLHWMAAVLAVFKAGGVYLPIEPHFPADRIARMLSRAGCRLVATEPGSTSTLYEALQSLPRVQGFFIETAFREDHADGNLTTHVEPDQLAYIYFTSGSTGEPKGAMCEHAGMLNHILAKVEDLEITPGEVVTQIAPQCFDISLWQLLSALLVGGHTLIVQQDTLLDPERFLDTIVDGRVGVMQVVPSYLEVLLSYLEQHPRDLPDLHCVSVTGEALTLDLTQRWFAAKPNIKLANVYGLTETSDDTNHEVMERAPKRGGVPLGRSIQNVHVYVVDERISPVPLGAPGEIVFSGVCVGRGYINDPERTRQAYLDDPLRPGHRLYRSGDYGRWRPDGKLEFLGRRDAQVKIRGFRIEIGEIENAIMEVPGVRQCAVVVTEGTDRGKQLVAFYSGGDYNVNVLTERLKLSLAEYMVPSAIHWWESLPLTANGKIDRKALVAHAGEFDPSGDDFQLPGSESERRLAIAWAKVLGVPHDQIGREDNFFDRGGTSLSAVELVIALDGAVSLKDVTRSPVLADQALLLDGSSTRQPGLLQLLSDSDDTPAGTLLCFPYAGGNAVNFQAMAKALRGSGLAVYAVELPGHDVSTESEAFAPMAQVVERVIDEVTRRGLDRVLIWGHSSGCAYAVETARQLQERGVDVQRLFIGAQLLGDAPDRRAHIIELTKHSNAEIATQLTANGGYTELAKLDAKHAEHVGAAYRHDCLAADRYLVDALDGPPRQKLAAPVTVVVAADDPVTAEWPNRHGDWQLLASQVDLRELPDGGHYFLRTRPNEAAQVVLQLAGTTPT